MSLDRLKTLFEGNFLFMISQEMETGINIWGWGNI